jgi:DNA repair protein RecO (recombination protein O)
MSLIKTPAIVLKSLNWKESSKIITVHTRELGKIALIAKGARRLKQRYSGVLESINLVEVVFYFSSKRQIQVLGSVSLENGFKQIKNDLEKTSYTYSILELISILIPAGSPDPVFFDFVKTLLLNLELAQGAKIIFLYFLLKISSYLGFRPEFDSCTKCSKQIVEGDSYFSFDSGGIKCQTCIAIDTKDWLLNAKNRDDLKRIQFLNYKTISGADIQVDLNFPYSEFLLAYLRFHTDEKLELNSLKMLK